MVRHKDFVDHPCDAGELGEPTLPVPIAARGSSTFYCAISAAYPEDYPRP
jgi:hypothetical protein